jgi:molybdenum cofactor cytidylyltransferase
MCEIGGMVLAAGMSERMDAPVPKQLLPLGSQTIAARIVDAAERSQLDRIVVITGYRGEEVAAAVAGGHAEIVANPEYRSGNMSSFRVGADALEDCDAVVVLLADMPGVTTEMIDRLTDEWRDNHPWAALSRYTDGPAHPLLFSAPALREAARVKGAKAVWRFLESAPQGRVSYVDFAMPAPVDINTRADYNKILRNHGSS